MAGNCTTSRVALPRVRPASPILMATKRSRSRLSMLAVESLRRKVATLDSTRPDGHLNDVFDNGSLARANAKVGKNGASATAPRVRANQRRPYPERGRSTTRF